MKKKVTIAIIVLVFAAAVYLLFPLADKRHAISVESEQVRRKEAFLETIRTGATGEGVNVILIMGDDLGVGEVSAYGPSPVATPNIDSIAVQGVLFTDGYCTSPICSPSRAGLLTGRYQQRFGFEVQPMNRYPRNRLEYYGFKYFVDTNDMVLEDLAPVPLQEDIEKQGIPASELTLGELLDARGYATALVGKWHLGYHRGFLPNQRGFGYQYGFYEAFSLYAPIGTPGIIEHRHDNFSIRHQWEQERKGSSAVRRNGVEIIEKEYLTFAIAKEAVSSIQKNRNRPFFLYVPFSAPHEPFQVPESYYNRFAHVRDHSKRVYYGMIAALDDAVGMILRRVEECGLDEKTLIIFASDNGASLYTNASDNRGMRGGKFTQFEGGLRVPYMMRWKGRLPRGSVYRHPVSLLDIFSTAAAVSGTPLPSDRVYDGVNLVPHVTGRISEPPHQSLFWRSMYNLAVRKGDWKLIHDRRSGVTELFHLAADRSETKVENESHPEKVRELLDNLTEWDKGLARPLWPHLMNYRFRDRGTVHYFSL